MEPIWTITLFGELTLSFGGSSETDTKVVRRFRSKKSASLLAYLAFYRGRAVSREFLCDMLWPTEPDGDITRNRFRVALASLRRQLEPPGVPPGAVIENVGNHQVRLRAETVATDVAAFETAIRGGNAAQAVALYRGGPLLPGFYEEWIFPEQERLALALQQLDAPQREREVPEETLPARPMPPSPRRNRESVSVPLYLTRFFGRDAERAQLATLLADKQARLITLTGPGGIGKTRLATEMAQGDPWLVAFVPLADIWNAGLLSDVLRQALLLPPDASRDALDQVVEQLNREPKVRLVLDNVEQIAQGAALFVGELLARVPGLFLLVTSRRRLDFPGEREVSIAPLPLPLGDSLQEVASAPSVLLFLDRAQSVRADYQITPRNVADFKTLCQLAGGIPLALELAAARAGILSPEQIRTRLAERSGGAEMEIASRRSHQKEERHRSMNAVVEWSYALLPPDLRRFFLALSVFRGGWDVAAAQAVTGEADALDYVSRLRGHSLVTPEGDRFRLLETLRSWAGERLETEATLHSTLTQRHAAYYRDVGEAEVAAAAGSALHSWERLEADEANLRAAFDYALTGDHESDLALQLALVLYALGRARGNLSDTLLLLTRALAFTDKSPIETIANAALRARTLLAAGELTQLARGAIPARTLLHAALPLARQSEQYPLIARTLRGVADNALFTGDYDDALPFYQEALTLQREIEDERGAAETLNSLALLARRKNNDFAEATRLTQESGEYFLRVGDTRMLSYNRFNLGELALDQNQTAAAESYFRESLALADALRDDWQRLYALFALARTIESNAQEEGRSEYHALMRDVLALALRIGDMLVLVDALHEQARFFHDTNDTRRAVILWGAADTIARKANREGDESEEKGLAEATKRFRLPVRTFRAAWNRGKALSPEEAIALAVSPVSVPTDFSKAGIRQAIK